MSIELKVPEIGESITEVEIGEWFKKEGDAVQKDDPIVTLESEKATVELSSPEAGTISRMLKKKGDVAKVGEVIGYLENGKAEATPSKAAAKAPDLTGPPKTTPEKVQARSEETAPAKAEKPAPAAPPAPAPRAATSEAPQEKSRSQRQLDEQEMPLSNTAVESEPAREPQTKTVAERPEEVVPMSRLRRTVAERLVEAQRNAALLTTFNEVDMSAILQLRREYGEGFHKKHNVKLGFMSFFVKAAIDALKQYPVVNAEIRGNDIVYHNYFDIGVAIGSGKGLVVPVLRNAERLSFAEIELTIGDFGRRARDNKLKPDELQGGTFTISNGGVYGSLLSTPIVNPPQSGVLGMHAIQDRPVAVEGNVVIRPMMYLALSYDHRIVDGREAVSCLKRIKEAIESPARMLMEI
ncbi:MAG TPA: 2-oxoglutarate dehydrogenase complex dihydrolipoyllysine-residue succinyltransferase [Verrucomicrobiae bacterium]|nr:2-oxoglutarate dehydrogenase complex dihydrolipoyllysine-residue succinyltransferase [Verrucomicrobiae bacterium]